MAFTSLDDILSEIGAGKFSRLTGFRTLNTGATSVAGRWHDTFAGGGHGGVGVLTGTAGLGTALSSSTAGAIPQITSSVSTDTKHLLSIQAVTSGSTVVPAQLVLTDLLYMYTSCVVTGTPTTLSNAAGKPTRFDNGRGVMASAIVATAIGAASPVLTMSYTDQSGNASNTGAFAASANSLPVGSMFTAGSAAAVLGSPNMNLAAGDSGVRQLDSYTLASGTTGTVTFMLHRPIASIPLVAVNVAGERDYLVNIPSLPKIEDDACLAFFVLIGGATVVNQQISYELGTAWG